MDEGLAAEAAVTDPLIGQRRWAQPEPRPRWQKRMIRGVAAATAAAVAVTGVVTASAASRRPAARGGSTSGSTSARGGAWTP
jgi:hypothetical protein